MKRLSAALAAAVSLTLLGVAEAASSNPPDYYPGQQGMASCLACHDTYGQFGGPGEATLGGLPEHFVPGEVYTMQVKVAQAGAKSFGFQMYAVDQDGQQAGTILTDDLTQDVRQARGVTFLKHSFHGSHADDQQTWTFQWKAPEDPEVRVGFYGEAVAADGHDEVKNDHVYRIEAVLEAGAPPSAD